MFERLLEVIARRFAALARTTQGSFAQAPVELTQPVAKGFEIEHLILQPLTTKSRHLVVEFRRTASTPSSSTEVRATGFRAIISRNKAPWRRGTTLV
jgi:hypothetical protein